MPGDHDFLTAGRRSPLERLGAGLQRRLVGELSHTVTADSGSAFTAEVSGKGTTTFTAPTQPGNYAFHCTYHPMMHGRLTVQ